MITPEYLNEIMDNVENSLSRLNEYLVGKIVKRILATFEEKGEIFIPSTMSDVRKLMKNGILYEDIQSAVEKALPHIKKEVRKAFLEAANEIDKQNLNFAKSVVKLEGLASVDVPNYEQVGIVQSAEELMMTPTEIRLLEQAYKRTIGEITNFTRTTSSICQTQYINACNDAYMKSQSGVSVQTAVTETIKELAQKGVQVVSYDSGHTDRMEVAVARAVRTGINQANAEIVLQRCAEMGVGYVKVSAHLGARVTKNNDYTNHSWWQGQVYSLNWNNDILSDFKPKESDYDGFEWLKEINKELSKKEYQKKYTDFVETCGYGDVQGIVGANCRHTFSAFYPGLQINDNERPDLKENEKRYKLEQKQRAMERAIRKTKRELEAYKADKEKFKEEIKQTRRKLENQSDKYMQFCKDNGLKPRNMALKIK